MGFRRSTLELIKEFVIIILFRGTLLLVSLTTTVGPGASNVVRTTTRSTLHIDIAAILTIGMTGRRVGIGKRFRWRMN